MADQFDMNVILSDRMESFFFYPEYLYLYFQYERTYLLPRFCAEKSNLKCFSLNKLDLYELCFSYFSDDLSNKFSSNRGTMSALSL
jgi:hypothetical protein